MKLAISNIAWDSVDDEAIYNLMNKYCFTGLEIAPTRIFSNNPYDKLNSARKWSENLRFEIPSMQSIWFGRKENIFGLQEERQTLIDYTKKAINFACAIGCKNLVFGCPRNRQFPNNADTSVAIDFFKTIGDYAASKNTCIGMEANPSIYKTNFINNTMLAIKLIEQVDSDGFKLNLDTGTMIQNNESVSILKNYVGFINHVHISEPYLKPIVRRKLHKQLKDLLFDNGYNKYISVEMGRTSNLKTIEDILIYVKEIFS